MESLSAGLNAAGMTCRSHSETAIVSVEENLVRLPETTYWEHEKSTAENPYDWGKQGTKKARLVASGIQYFCHDKSYLTC